MNQKNKFFFEYIKKSEIFGDEEKRKTLLDILYTHFFESDYYTIDRLKKLDPEKKWQPYIKPLIHIARDSTLRYLTENNDLLSAKITLDIANWLEKNYQRMKHNEKIKYLKNDFLEFSNQYTSYTEKEWVNLLKKLKEIYPNFGRYWEFYEKKLRKLYKEARNSIKNGKYQKYNEINEKIEVVHKKILEDYERALEETIKKIEEREIEKLLSSLKTDLKKHEIQLINFIDVISSIMGFISMGAYGLAGYYGNSNSSILAIENNERFWDLSFGFWKTTVNWDAIDKYARILEENEQIKELAELLGRLHKSEEDEEKQLIEKTKIVHEWKVDYAGKSEIKGIHFSDDLSSLLPSEVALLSIPETEIIFAKKFVEKKLLTYYYEDKYRIEKEIPEMIEKRKKKKEDKKGPIIICVDTSGSMAGIPEIVAKTIILAILRIALRDKRDCYLISFSTGIETLEISDLAINLPKLINFMQMGFHGGTNATPALVEALRMLENEKYEKADVIMISDFIMGNIPQEIVKKIEIQKEKKTKFHSIVISPNANPHVTHLFNTEWLINPENYDNIYFTVKKIKKIL
ncbi:VWA domain-containing protein [Methanocaldococcus sp.]